MSKRVDDAVPGLLVKQSPRTYEDTVAALLDALQRRNLTVFDQIDHAAAALEAGLDLQDEQVILFGNPRAGTPLMQADRRVGIELPLRILIWRDGDEVNIGYRDPRELSDSYELSQHSPTLEQMAKLLDELTGEAAS